MSSSSSLASQMAFMDDSDEEQVEDEDMLLGCVLAREYLEEKEERSKYYVRERIAWEQHIAELTAEGNDAFQQLYRMDFSSFLNLCSIICSQVQVNETEKELNDAAPGFGALSSHSAIKGYVACLDVFCCSLKYLQKMKQVMSRQIFLAQSEIWNKCSSCM